MNRYRLQIAHALIVIVREPIAQPLLLTLDQAKASAFDRGQSIANSSGRVVTVRLADRPFLTIYPLPLKEAQLAKAPPCIALQSIDTCSIDSLTDHCNGDREYLLSIACPSLDTEENMRSIAQSALTDELTQVDRPSLPYLSLECRRSLARHALKHHTAIGLHPWPSEADRLEADPDQEVRLWFRLSW